MLTDEERVWYTRLFEDFLNDVEYMQPHVTFCHGDCTPGNVLLGSDPSHLQVIDWDDMTIGDPARDLCRWLGSFGEDFLHTILEHYTIPVDAYFIKRVKFYYCRTPLLYFSMAQQFESTRFLDFARQELFAIREKSKQQGWFWAVRRFAMHVELYVVRSWDYDQFYLYRRPFQNGASCCAFKH